MGAYFGINTNHPKTYKAHIDIISVHMQFHYQEETTGRAWLKPIIAAHARRADCYNHYDASSAAANPAF